MKLKIIYISLILFGFVYLLPAQNDTLNVVLKYQKSKNKQVSFPILEEEKYSKIFFIEKNKLIIEINTFRDTIIKENKIILVSDYIMSRGDFEFAILVPQKYYEIKPKYIIVKFNKNRIYYFKKKNKIDNLFILRKEVKINNEL